MSGLEREIIAADLGGTHARFALARVAGGRVSHLGAPHILATADHAGLEAAWAAFTAGLGRPAPRAAAIAVAAPVAAGAAAIPLTNSPWVIHPAPLPARLGLDALLLLNDFAAVAHGVAQLEASHFRHVCGPDAPLPAHGSISIIGPGTGLGVALLRREAAGYAVLATEGGHIGFAPGDALEDAILARLRRRHGRVSVERVVSGPGLAVIAAALTGPEGGDPPAADTPALWQAALAGEDRHARAALDGFCRALGGVAGDMALAHGADAVVVAGGLGLRLAAVLPGSGFAARFEDKGRYRARMAALPVRLLTHPQPGLLGAAAAFAQAHP